MSQAIGQSKTDQLAGVRVEWEHPDWLADLAADLDLATRVAMRLRPDGLIEVTSMRPSGRSRMATRVARSRSAARSASQSGCSHSTRTPAS